MAKVRSSSPRTVRSGRSAIGRRAGGPSVSGRAGCVGGALRLPPRGSRARLAAIARPGGRNDGDEAARVPRRRPPRAAPPRSGLHILPVEAVLGRDSPAMPMHWHHPRVDVLRRRSVLHHSLLALSSSFVIVTARGSL